MPLTVLRFIMSETETEKTPSLSRLDRRIARMESTPSSKKRSTAPGRPPCIEHALTIRDLQDYFGFEAPQAIYKRQEGKTIPSVDNLIALTDWNGQQIDGPVDEVAGQGDLRCKWEAFGWHVIVADGHDFNAILDAYAQALSVQGKPVMILFKTEMGHGIDFMAGTHKWHGKAPKPEEVEAALAQLPETLGDY